MNDTNRTPTHAEVLALKDEQRVVEEAYDFLDEKRLLLAAELIRQLRNYQRLSSELNKMHERSRDLMEKAIGHHGLNGLQVYPSAPAKDIKPRAASRNFMGVTLIDGVKPEADWHGSPDRAANPSGVTEDCRELFCSIVDKSFTVATISGNLYRLLREYRLTERRARALENVILPEIKASLRVMAQHLEELEMEDAIRVRLQRRQG